MTGPTWVPELFGAIAVGAPLVPAIVLGVRSLLDRRPDEAATTRLIQWSTVAGLLASIGLVAAMLAQGRARVTLDLGNWVAIPDFHFLVKLDFDWLSIPFVLLTYVLTGTVGAFASRYLHGERGFHRFFVLYAFFLLGMILAALAGTIETLFTGWELVGLSSALLVSYYQDRPGPARNALWIWGIYRVSDAALLLAAVVLHHMKGGGNFDELLRASGGTSGIAPSTALVVGMLLLIAAAGKSALVPFSGWLPRAMEGPTPSSAVFYGALSVHLGAFLLLRMSPLLDESIVLSAMVVTLGLATAALAYVVGSVQTDIKSMLSYASMLQVGLIVAEIGAGLRWIPLAHIVGHASLRTLQFLRAPTLLHDYHVLENALGHHVPRGAIPWRRLLGEDRLAWLYRLALERGYLDAMLRDYIVGPFVRLFSRFDAMERRLTDRLEGGESRESERVHPHHGAIEELT